MQNVCYVVWGIKQRREPISRYAYEGAEYELTEARPALAPLVARPPNKSPRNASPDVGMLV